MHDIIDKALTFAAIAHDGQKRKYTGHPYIVHPIAVATLVKSVSHTPEMIAASYLHDVCEPDCAHVKTIDEIEWTFGPTIASYVSWLTDVSKPTDGNRAIRKMIDREHTRQAPPAAKTIKLADLIDNTKTIEQNDPAFAAIYLAEKKLLLEVLKEGDPTLYRIAVSQVLMADSA